MENKITILFPLKDPDDLTLQTLKSLLNQSFQNFVIKIFINDYKKVNKNFIQSNWKIFKNKKIILKTFRKNYGQLKNVKKAFRNVNTQYFMLTTNGIVYYENYLQILSEQFEKYSDLILSTCEFAIRNHEGDLIAKYPITKTKNIQKYNKIQFHYEFINRANSAGTKINGIFNSKVLKEISMFKNLDWDKLFVYQASLIGKVIVHKNVLASKIVRENFIQDIKFKINDLKYKSILEKDKELLFYFHHRSKINVKEKTHILVTHDWLTSQQCLKILNILIKEFNFDFRDITIKYSQSITFAKQLFSDFYKIKPKYLSYFEFLNFILYFKFLIKNLFKIKQNKKLYFFFKALYVILKRKKIFSIFNYSFRIDLKRQVMLKSFYHYEKKNKLIFYTTSRNFNNINYFNNKLSGAIKSSENILNSLNSNINKIRVYVPPKIIPDDPFSENETQKISNNKEKNSETLQNNEKTKNEYYKIKTRIKENKFDYYFFQKTLDYNFFNYFKNTKNRITISHNIEYLHYIKKIYLTYFVSKLRKKLIFRELLLNDKLKYNVLLFLSIFRTIKKKNFIRFLKEIKHNFLIYKKSKFIIKTIIVESIFDKIYKKKILFFAPVVKNYININSKLKDENFIYLSCIGSGNRSVYGDFQLLNFINFLKSNNDFIYKNRNNLKIMVSGDTDGKILDYLKNKFSFLDQIIITPKDNLNNFLEDNFVVNFIIDENSTGIRTKFYDNLFSGNIGIFSNKKQINREVIDYHRLIKTKLVFDLEDKSKLFDYLNELKSQDLIKIKERNKIVAKNYNEILKDNNKLSLLFLNGMYQ